MTKWQGIYYLDMSKHVPFLLFMYKTTTYHNEGFHAIISRINCCHIYWSSWVEKVHILFSIVFIRLEFKVLWNNFEFIRTNKIEIKKKSSTMQKHYWTQISEFIRVNKIAINKKPKKITKHSIDHIKTSENRYMDQNKQLKTWLKHLNQEPLSWSQLFQRICFQNCRNTAHFI